MKILAIYILATMLSICTYAQSQQLIDSLQVQLEYHKSNKLNLEPRSPKLYDSTEANILYELSKVYWYSKPDTALIYANLSKELSEKIDYQKGIGFAFYSIGVSYVWKPDLSLALLNTEKAISVAKNINNKKLLASSYLNTGIINSQNFNYPEAMNLYSQALIMAEEAEEKEIMIWANINMGYINSELNINNEALRYYNNGLKIAREIKDIENEAALLNNIGCVYKCENKFEKSNFVLLESLAIFEKIKDNYCISFTSGNIGSNYLELAKNDQASLYLLKALKIAHDNQFSICQGKALLDLGILSQKQKKYWKAIEYFNLAIPYINECKDLQMKEAVNCYLYTVYLEMAESKLTPSNLKMKYSYEALKYNKLYVLFKDSIKSEENSKKITQINMQNEYDKKGLTLKIEQDKKDKIEDLKKVILFTIFGLIFIIGMIYFYFYKQRQKIINQLSIEQTKNLISRDLHDELGSNLSSISMQASVIKRKLSRQEDVQDIVENISTASQDMVSKMSDIVWSLQTENENANHFIERISNYCAITLPDNNIQFEIKHNLGNTNININSSVLKELYLIAKEAINNSLKHAQCKKITIDFTLIENNFCIQLSDDGKGFDINKPSRTMGGNGLKNIKQRAAKIGATFLLESSEEMGTRILVKLPIT